MAFEKRRLALSFALALLASSGCTPPEAPPPPPPQLPDGWTALQPMRQGVGEAAAVELDGKIYVLGGFDTRDTVQIYDIATDTWRIGPPLYFGTDNAGALAIGGKIHVFGGEASPSVQVLDVTTETWSLGPDLPYPRYASVVEWLEGKAHLVGGWSLDRTNNISTTSHAVFDPAIPGYVAGGAAPASTARNHAFSGVIEGKLYATGGRKPGHEGEDAQNVALTEVYDPAFDRWAPLASLPTPRSGGGSAVLDGKLYVLGGGLPGNSVHATIERYDPVTDQWEQLGDMPTPRTGHRVVAASGSLYVLGGFFSSGSSRTGNSGTNAFYRYTPTP